MIDFVGEAGAEQDVVRMLRRAGTHYIIGYGGRLNVPLIDIISTEINFIGNLVGTYNDLVELMTLTAQGKVTLYTSDGAFRAGPELAEFDKLYAEMAAQIDGQKLIKVAEQIDRYVFDEALALFLCAPQALYAVNKHVNFGLYRTTFELAETEVDEQHWSQRNRAASSQAAQAAATPSSKGLTGFSGASSGNAC